MTAGPPLPGVGRTLQVDRRGATLENVRQGLSGVTPNDEPSGSRIEGAPRGMRLSGSNVSAGFALAIVVALLFHGVLRGRMLFWMDTHLTFEPLFALLGAGLSRGQLLWTSLIGAGKPMLANPTVAAFYPPNLLFAVLSAHRAVSLLTMLHVVVGSWGAFALAKRLKLDDGSAFVSGLVFAASGATLSATPYVGLSWCSAWVPWLLVFADRVASREWTVRSLMWLAAVVFMMLTLTEPMVLAGAGLGALLVLEERGLAADGRATVRVRDHLVLPVVAVAAAVIVASPYLVALAVNLPHSVRALGFTAEGVTIWSLHPLRLVEILAPGVFGALGQPQSGALWAGALAPVKGFFYIPSLYIGAPVVALAVAGAARRSPWRTSLTTWLLILFLLALGRWGPIYPWLDDLPGVDAARYPVKWMVGAVVPICLLAGMGVRNLFVTRNARSRNVFVVALVLGAVILAMIASAVQLRWFGRVVEAAAVPAGGAFTAEAGDTVASACIRGLLPAVAALGLFVLERRRRFEVGAVTGSLAVLIAVDLLSANGHLIATTEPAFYVDEPAALRVVRGDPRGFDRIRVDENSSGIARWVAGHPTLEEMATFQRQILAGYVAADFGVPEALTRDIEATGPANVYLLTVLAETAPPREQAMIYGSAAITHMVTDRHVDQPEFDLLATVRTIAGSPIRVYRNTLARPRVSLVGAVIPYRGDDGYRRVLRGSSPDLFANAALVDADDLAAAPPGLDGLVPWSGFTPAGRVGSARIVADEGHRLTIHAEPDAPAVLVVSDAYLAQWTARVDGGEAPLLRVNYAFRGVLLEPGEHVVELVYNPWRW